MQTTNPSKPQQFDNAIDNVITEGTVSVSTTNMNNDNFADSIEIVGPEATVMGSNMGFTSETGEPNQGFFGSVNSAWWSWTAPTDVGVLVNTFGSNFDTFLSIFTGNSVGTLATVLQNDDAGGTLQSRLAFIATAGQTYHFAVDGYGSNTGSITLNLSESGPAITGTPGADVPLDGTSGIDYILGLEGNDVIRGFAQSDFIDGGAGNDNIFGVAGADFLLGGDGIDTLNYSDSIARVSVTLNSSFAAFGGTADGDITAGFENLVGSNFNDSLGGDEGNNVLRGRGGDDSLFGNGGNDTLIGGAGADFLDGGAGIDFLNYIESSAGVTVTLSSGFFDTTTGVGGDAEGDTNLGIERMIGSNFGDTLTGNSVGNVLQGRAGNDTLSGERGRDILIGGSGNDTLTGGVALDAFRFLSTAEGVDTITDFDEDLIQVKGNNFGGGLTAGLLDDSQFVLGSVATTADHRFVYDSGALYFDQDGSGAASQILIANVQNNGAAAVLSASNIQTIF